MIALRSFTHGTTMYNGGDKVEGIQPAFLKQLIVKGLVGEEPKKVVKKKGRPAKEKQ